MIEWFFDRDFYEDYYGYIYLTTNMINGKKYVGQSTKFDLMEDYLGSGSVFLKALSKYGKDSFFKEVLKFCESKKELDEAEIFYINKYDTLKKGYNLVNGGAGLNNPSFNTRMKMSKAAKGNKSAVGSKGRRGIPHKESTKRKIALKALGNKRALGHKNGLGNKLTEEHKRKLLESRKGKPLSDIHKNRISSSLKGREFTEETRRKMSEAAKRRWGNERN